MELMRVTVENLTEEDPLLCEIKQEMNDEEEFVTGEGCSSVLDTLHSASTSDVARLPGRTYPVPLHTQCGVCGKFVKQLRKHMRTHTGLKNYKCYLCGSEFTVAGSLMVHMRIHTGEVPFSCDQCGKKFPTKSRLNSHKQCHANGMPHECHVCHEKFKHYESVRRHMRKHSQTSRLNYSGEEFSEKLDVSETGGHPNAEKNQLVFAECSAATVPAQLENRESVLETAECCQTSKTSGKSVVNLRKHCQTHNGIPEHFQPCNVCGKFVADMYKHKLVHQRHSQEHQTCKICGKRAEDMQRHMQLHQETRFDLEQVHQERAQKETPAHYKSCEICGKAFADLYKHKKTHTKRTPTFKSCDVCGKVVSDLYRHRKVHGRPASRSQSCDVCGKIVVDMYKHKLVHRGLGRPHRLCTICGKSVKDLARHREIHEGSQREQHQKPCDICGKIVTNMGVHRRTHDEHGEVYQCTQCEQYYPSNASLRKHMKTHTSQKNYVCAECGKRYSSKTALSTHMWRHSSEPRYQCTVCSKAFHGYTTWKRHLWMHGIGVDRMHSCVVCTKCFASPYLLRDHMRTHSGEKPYMCYQCGNRFTYKASLNSHQKCYHSEKKSNCPECGKAIRAPRMAMHMRSMHRGVIHKCPYCKLGFRQQIWLDWHVLSHASAEPFICDDCCDKDVSLPDQFTDLPHDTDFSSGSMPQIMPAASNVCLQDNLDISVKDTAMATSTVKEENHDDYTVKLERLSPGEETSQLVTDDSIAVCGDISAQAEVDEAVDDKKLLDASKDLKSGTAEEAEVSDDTDWKTAADELYVSPAAGEDRCIRCNKLRPLQQCPVCHGMYSSVAVHIGIHSIRKMHMNSSTLDACPADENGVLGLTQVFEAAVSNTDEGSSRSSDQTKMCSDCGEILPNTKTLRSHMKTCLKFVTCTVCGTVCRNETNLRWHMKRHMNTGAVTNVDKNKESMLEKGMCQDFSCAACEMEFGNAELLSQHMEEHMDTEQRICHVCNKTFMNVDTLKSHMRSHTGKMPFQCETCGKVCRTCKDLREHCKVHSSDKQHICTTCGKRFRLRKTYLRHRVIHSGEKNYACEYCGMRFSFKYRRSRHMLVHTGDKPYVCSTCGERFTQWNGLSQHQLRSCRK